MGYLPYAKPFRWKMPRWYHPEFDFLNTLDKKGIDPYTRKEQLHDWNEFKKWGAMMSPFEANPAGPYGKNPLIVTGKQTRDDTIAAFSI